MIVFNNWLYKNDLNKIRMNLAALCGSSWSRALFVFCTHWWACWAPAPDWDPSAAFSSPQSSWPHRADRRPGRGYWARPPLPDRNLGSVQQAIKKKLLGQSERRNRFSCLHSKSVWYYSKRSFSKKLSAVGQSFSVSNSSWICSFFPCISYSHRSECVPHNASVLAMQFPSACWRRSAPVSCRLAGSMRCCTLFNSSTSSVLMLVTTSPNKPTSAMPFQKFSVSSADKQTTQSNLTHTQCYIYPCCWRWFPSPCCYYTLNLCLDVCSVLPEISADPFLSADSDELELQSNFPLRTFARSSAAAPPLPRITWPVTCTRQQTWLRRRILNAILDLRGSQTSVSHSPTTLLYL